jgi:hypothetical protein
MSTCSMLNSNRFDVDLFYHGTSTKSVESIEKHGFKVSKKTGGCNEILGKHNGLHDPNSGGYNYFTTDRKVAAEYAKMHTDPAIVRLITRPSIMSPDLEDPTDTVFKTSKKVSKICVLKMASSRSKSKVAHRIAPSKSKSKLAYRIARKLELLNKNSENKNRNVISRIEKLLNEAGYNDTTLIRDSVSPIQKEEERDRHAFKAIELSGVDTSNLQEGQTYSIQL